VLFFVSAIAATGNGNGNQA